MKHFVALGTQFWQASCYFFSNSSRVSSVFYRHVILRQN